MTRPTESPSRPLRRVIHLSWMLVAGLVVALGGIVVLFIALRASDNAKQAQKNAQAICETFGDFARDPIAATASERTIKFVANVSNGYYIAECQFKYGELPTPDPRVVPYLKEAPH